LEKIEKANKVISSGGGSGGEDWIREYMDRSKPAHVQLADKMGKRGQPVEVGTRIEFVIVKHPDTKARQFEKIEDPVYCKKHGDLVQLDSLYYLQSLAKPLDQLFETVFGQKGFLTKLCKIHIQYAKIQEVIFYRDGPMIRFVGVNGQEIKTFSNGGGLVKKSRAKVPARAKTIYDD
jgi:hypothetical protein